MALPQTKAQQMQKTDDGKWRRSLYLSLFIAAALLIIYALWALTTSAEVSTVSLSKIFDSRFYWMLAGGFFAELIASSLGIGYGVIATVFLMSMGVDMAIVSGSVHASEVFSSGAAAYSHQRLGNINKKLFRSLVVPGIIGAILGALVLLIVNEKYASVVRPFIALYTMFLGIRILYNAFAKKKPERAIKKVGILALCGGFLDSFGGGGWGPLVTGTLISKGRTPRYIVGSSSVSKFFVTVASAFTFFFFIKLTYIQVILGLIVGGLIAAPLGARLITKLPMKAIFIAVGAAVILSSGRTIWMAVEKLMH
jgi:uncharacterized membrane protein YfcA